MIKEEKYNKNLREVADDKMKNIPVIFISSHTDSDEIKKAYSAGGADYIIKPFNHEEVLTRIETHLKIHFLEIELEECKTKLSEYEKKQ